MITVMFGFIENVVKSISKYTNFTRVVTPNGVVLYVSAKGFLPFFKLNNDKKVYLYYQWLKAKIHSCSFVSCIKQSSNPKRWKFDVRIR